MTDLSEPLVQDDPERVAGLGKAAWILEDALAENLVEDYPGDQEARTLFFQCAQANKRYIRCIMIMFFLSMFETPTWCTPLWKQPEGHKGPDFPVHGFWTYKEDICLQSMDAQFEDWFDKEEEGKEREEALAFMFSGVPYVPPGWGLIIETILLCIMWQKLSLDRQLQTTYFKELTEPGEKPVTYFNLKINAICRFMVLVEMVDMAIFFAFRNPFRVIWITRFVFMVTIPSVGILLMTIKGIIVQFITIAVFFIGGLGLSAWIVTMILQPMGKSASNDYQYVFKPYDKWVNRSMLDPSSTPDHPVYFYNKHPEEFEEQFEEMEDFAVNNGFTNVVVSIVSMFIAGATDDFYEKFRNTYSKRRAYGLLWLAFLVIVHVLLLSLVLDTLVSAYTKHNEEQEEEGVSNKAKGMLKAFKELTNTCSDEVKEGLKGRTIKEKDFIDFALEYGKSPNQKPLSKEQAECLFKAVARKSNCAVENEDDGERSLLLRGFVEVCGLMKFNIWFTVKDSPVKDQLPSLWNAGWFQKLYDWTQEPKDGESPLNRFMNGVLGVNLILVVLEAVFELQKNGEKEEEEWGLPNLELMFSFIYLLEVSIKLCVWSWEEYFSTPSNVFDFAATFLLLGSSALGPLSDMLGGGGDAGAGFKKAMNMLRLLRLVRVVKQLKQFPAVQFMIGTISKLVMKAQGILGLLLVVVYFFTTLGVQIFGGILWKGREKVEETEWNEEHYYVLNFNDFLNSFGCWVVLLLTEYKHGFTQAMMKAGPRGSFLVFPLFYICSVSIIFELVKAFTIEAFVDMFKENNAEKKEFAEKKSKRSQARDRLNVALEKKKDKKEKKGMCSSIAGACKGGDPETELKREVELLEKKMSTHVNEEVKALLEKQIEEIKEMQEENADPLEELKDEFEEEQGKKLHTAVDAGSKEMKEIIEQLECIECVGEVVELKNGEKVKIVDFDVYKEKKGGGEEGEEGEGEGEGEEEEEEEEEEANIFAWMVQSVKGGPIEMASSSDFKEPPAKKEGGEGKKE